MGEGWRGGNFLGSDPLNKWELARWGGGKRVSGPGNSMGACMEGLEMARNPDALAPSYGPHI